jgi:spoIIIJ-associated protein
MGQRFEGKNLQDAIENAARELGVEAYRVDYTVLVERRGFLGGIKRIVIEAAVTEGDVKPPPPPPPPAATPPSAPPRSAPRSPRSDRPSGGDRGRDRGPRSRERGRSGGYDDRPRRRDDGERGRLQGRERQSERWESSEPVGEIVATPEQPPRSPQEEKAASWCEELFGIMGYGIDVRTAEAEDHVDVRLYGADARKLTARGGEQLDSIQIIANKALVGRLVEKPIEFDASGFKEQRSDEIAARARTLAERVRTGGGEQLLPAMSPIERRIVHLALKDDEEVTTVSRGDGFYKRVAIVRRSDEPAVDG